MWSDKFRLLTAVLPSRLPPLHSEASLELMKTGLIPVGTVDPGVEVGAVVLAGIGAPDGVPMLD